MGGKIRLLTTVEKTYRIDTQSLNITGTLSISSQEATKIASQTFQSTLNGYLTFGWEEVKTNTTFAQSNDWDIFGKNPNNNF